MEKDCQSLQAVFGMMFRFSRLIVMGPLLLWTTLGCTSAPADPSLTNGDLRRIDVIYADWHARIVETEPAARAKAEWHSPLLDGIDDDRTVYRIWDFAEKKWYLDNEQGATGIARALFWPTRSCIGGVITLEPPWEVQTDPPIEGHWTFYLPESNYRAMKQYIDSIKGDPIPGEPRWYWGKRKYHLFYNCNHFTAAALREAGLPIKPGRAAGGPLITRQLDRAEEARLSP